MMEATYSIKPNGDRVLDRIAIFASQQDYSRGLNLLLCTVDYQDRIVAVVKNLTFEGDVDPHGFIEPTLTGPPASDFLQAALDAAWKVGMRPKNWRDERPEQVNAMDAHLQDMRRLVFGGPPPPPEMMMQKAVQS